jgi:ABC-type Fe3+/spermidine/putrescine transport system ATPase subunit
MSFLSVEGVYKEYEGAPLLTDVSFRVERGEIVSLLGPSGSGKTTLLRIIAGLESSEAGRVYLEGQDLQGVPVHRRSIVLMFQEYALFPHRTVFENVAFGLRMRRYGREEIEARVKEMLALVGLESFGERSVVDLSGGERQRVALARSLAPEPRLLLLDEPLGALDRTLRDRLLEELSVILRRVGVTTITVTHDQAEAFALADRVVLLHDTQIVQRGTPEEIYRRPATPWVARFLGFTNLIPAEVTDHNEVATSFGRLRLELEGNLPGRGTSGTLLIPPWGIRVAGEKAAVNGFSATVTRRLFQGHETKLRLQVGTAELGLTLEMGTQIPGEGEEVNLQIMPAALRWYPEEAER